MLCCVDIHIRLCWTQKSVNRCAVDHKHLNTVADESYRRDQQLHLPAGVRRVKNLHFLGGKAWGLHALLDWRRSPFGWVEGKNTDLRGSQPMFGGFDSAFLQSRMALNFALCFEFELLWIMTGCVLGVYIETSHPYESRKGLQLENPILRIGLEPSILF